MFTRPFSFVPPHKERKVWLRETNLKTPLFFFLDAIVDQVPVGTGRRTEKFHDVVLKVHDVALLTPCTAFYTQDSLLHSINNIIAAIATETSHKATPLGENEKSTYFSHHF